MHRIYTGNHIRGGQAVPFGKCLCGLYMKNQQEIDEHRKKILGGGDA